MLEVVVVVEDLLGLLADVKHSLNRLHRVFPPQGFRTQHDPIRAVKHRVRNVRRLRSVGFQG